MIATPEPSVGAFFCRRTEMEDVDRGGEVWYQSAINAEEQH